MRDLLAARADELGDGRHLDAQALEGQLLEDSRHHPLAQQIGGDHGVEGDVARPDALVGQHHHVVLGVVGRLLDTLVLQAAAPGGGARRPAAAGLGAMRWPTGT